MLSENSIGKDVSAPLTAVLTGKEQADVQEAFLESYYLEFPEIMTLEDFVKRLEVLDAQLNE